jgi:hypothetical protein
MVAPSDRRGARGLRFSLFRSICAIAALIVVVVAVSLLRPEQQQQQPESSVMSMLELPHQISVPPNDSFANPITVSSTPDSALAQGQMANPATISSSLASAHGQTMAYDPFVNPLGIPPGKAQNLPSIRVLDSSKERKRSKENVIYGGDGDKKHLGGFTAFDIAGVSPRVWKTMIQEFGVKSVLDVGCGRGTSTTWFLTHGVDVLCVEGSHDAYEKTFLPDPATQMVEHDFSRGPWWPEKTYDAAWAVEFLEHVNLQHQFNYITAFRKAALLFVSSSRWGG